MASRPLTNPVTYGTAVGTEAMNALDTSFGAVFSSGFNDSALGWVNYGADTGTVNNYAVTLTPAPSGYSAGLTIVLSPANTNNAASTINVNSLGAQTIQNAFGNVVAGGDITAGELVTLVFTGTVFKIISPCPSNLLGLGPSGGLYNFGNQRVLFDDFYGYGSGTGFTNNTYFGSQLPWYVALSGAGAALGFVNTYADSTDKAFGVLQGQSGTQNTGISRTPLGPFWPGLGALEMDLRVLLSQAPSGTDNFFFRFGIADTGFVYNNTIQIQGTFTTSSIIQGITVSGGTNSTTSTAALAGGSFLRLRIVINAAWTAVSFFLNGVQIGSNITTNIPTGVALSPVIAIEKTAGTTSCSWNADQFYMSYLYTV